MLNELYFLSNNTILLIIPILESTVFWKGKNGNRKGIIEVGNEIKFFPVKYPRNLIYK